MNIHKRKTWIMIALTTLTFHALSQTIHHEIIATLDPSRNYIEVEDRINLPETFLNRFEEWVFSLNSHLTLTSQDERLIFRDPRPRGDSARYLVYNFDNLRSGTGDLIISVTYAGVIHDPITEGAAAVARGFSETSGTINPDGVYLGGASYWLPAFADPLFTFNLEVTLPADWQVVSQGSRTRNEPEGAKRVVRYESPHPDQEAYLIAGPFTEYSQPAGNILVQAFLRKPDEELANRYIGVTANYIRMYEQLIGPYPYTKFALVENFWETGYGMPSFTLLGEKVIRLPFILHTSYPHELVHNWWGNSVYVDMVSGNWCEGITAYMADHLLKEQQGQGAEYRQTTLQKYTDYVNESNDFPLVDFRSRNNSAEEAIGYGKCLMVNHMLRGEVGDELFVESYRDFYINNRFRIASFQDIKASFEKVTNLNLEPFFNQWLLRTGAPELRLTDLKLDPENDLYRLAFTLEQVQPGDPFFVSIPVALYYESEVELQLVTMDLSQQEFTLELNERPIRMEIDPQFDVFRRLDKAEVPPALSQLFGSADAVLLLPADSPFLEEYRQLAESWKKSQEVQGKSLEILTDADLTLLPANQSVWILGFENKFAGEVRVTQDYAAALGEETLSGIAELEKTGSLVYAFPYPGQEELTIGFVASQVQEAIAGLARLLPHYGKYSYLGFSGTRPDNVLKGNFPALHSPLHVNIPFEGKTVSTSARLQPQPPLIIP